MHVFVQVGDQSVLKSAIEPAKTAELIEAVLGQHRDIIAFNQQLLASLSCRSLVEKLAGSNKEGTEKP